MGYYHKGCNGYIDPKLPLRCNRCGKVFPIWYLLYPSKKDTYFLLRDPKYISKVTRKAKNIRSKQRLPVTAYAFASYLPKWPLWARLLTSILVVGGLSYLTIIGAIKLLRLVRGY